MNRGIFQSSVHRSSLLQKDCRLTVEDVVIPGKESKALLTYRNVSNALVQIIQISRSRFEEITRDKNGFEAYKKLKDYKVVSKRMINLSDPKDYRVHTVEIPVSALECGEYAFVVSNGEDISDDKYILNYGSFQCSNISYISRTLSEKNGALEYVVLDREKGFPLKDVSVKVYLQEYDYKDYKYKDVLYKTLLTDAMGKVLIHPPKEKNRSGSSLRAEFSLGKDHLNTEQNQYLYFDRRQRNSKQKRTFFFTDRSIYRPGQIIYFKGIVLSLDEDSSSILSKWSTSVSLYDVNGEQIDVKHVTTNEFGTFSGSFTAPNSGLTGIMRIGDNFGSRSISVEEYKRPKFEVEHDPVKGVFRLNESIKISGKAKAYAGSSIDGAVVKYRVVREARFPYWYRWWIPYPISPAMEIIHGECITNEKGEFEFDFKAIPDYNISKSSNPNFIYKITTDVTDQNGETRSGLSTVTAGYTSVNLSVDMPQYLNRENSSNKFPIKATNMSGSPEPLKGTITIYALKAPDHAVKRRLWQKPDMFLMNSKEHTEKFPHEIYSNENEMDTWERSKKVLQTAFDTKKDPNFVFEKLSRQEQGAYVLEATATDSFGEEVKSISYFTLYSTKEKKLPYQTADIFIPVKNSAEPGESASFIIGSGFDDVRVFYELSYKNSVIDHKEIPISNSQQLLQIPIEERYRGNVAVHVLFVRHNRIFMHTENIIVPWTNKNLNLEFMTFRDKLQPGKKEQWRLKISGPENEKVTAEMVAALYDASLDAFKPHGFDFSIYPNRYANSLWNTYDHLMQTRDGAFFERNMSPVSYYPSKNYPEFYWGNYSFYDSYYDNDFRPVGKMGTTILTKMAAPVSPASPPPESESMDGLLSKVAGLKRSADFAYGGGVIAEKENIEQSQPTDMSKVQVRSNLNETAFFYPDLLTDKNGEVSISFTIPEALTRWKMLGFAHTKDLKYGFIQNNLVTQKELMVMPNPPRFFRENDRIFFTAKITNMTDKDIDGIAQLELFNAVTMEPVDALFGNNNSKLKFAVKKGLSTPVTWELQVPEDVPAVNYRVIAKAGNFSDGEEKIVPVVSNRMLVTESMPMSIKQKGEKKFRFEKLISQNNGSKTLKNHKLTLEFTSNPVWYALQSLPYLIEYPYECAEQMFSRFYANSIASHIVNSNPKIKKVFDSWKDATPESFLSKLEKNQELKSLLLEETPWLIDGKKESERNKQLAVLFDINKMSNECNRTLNRLIKMQVPNGGWPWFDGGPDDQYITQHIVTGFARLNQMKIINVNDNSETNEMIKRAIHYMDEKLQNEYEEIKKHSTLSSDNLTHSVIQYLYTRSFFRDIPVSKRGREAFDYFFDLARKYWLQKNRYLQGMIALALNRYDEHEISSKIIASLKENAIQNEEMGMYWKENYEGGWYWWQAPIETQVLLIEAFDEVAHDTASVEEMKLWLLKSKQTQNWSTTKATTDAIYALIRRGIDLFQQESNVQISLGDIKIDPKKVPNAQAGTGYFKKSWVSDSINKSMGDVIVSKKENGVAWGAVYWQYFEQLDKIVPHETPLKLNKKLFVQRLSDKGVTLEPVTGQTALKPGDKITVRIELRSDRDLEYVHMKDMRASGFEPLNVLSGYKWQDGFGYYESTRDVSTNFFISFLRKGTYVFEYPLVVNHAGDFSNGVTTIQCMYAPEYTSHSEGLRVKVGR